MVNPEFRVLRGEVLSAASADHLQVEEAYRAAIRGARMAGLHMVELQARTRLVPLLRGRGEDDELDELRKVHESIQGGRRTRRSGRRQAPDLRLRDPS